MSPEEQEQRAQSVALIEQGYSWREVMGITGISNGALAKTLERTRAEAPDLTESIRARAAELASKAVERMHERIDVVEDKLLASWAYTGAKLGGVLEAPEGSAASNMAELVNRLTQGGNSVTVGVRVEPAPSQTAPAQSSATSDGRAASDGGGSVEIPRIPR